MTEPTTGSQAEMSPGSPGATSLPAEGRTILRNTLFITGSGLALKLVNFLYGIWVVQSLGDDRFGQYKVVLAWVGLFTIVAELGVTQYALREMARDRGRTETFFWNLVAVRGLLALVGIIGITAGAAAIGYPDVIVSGVFVFTCSFLFSAVGASLETVLTAHERLDYTSVTAVVSQVVTLALGAAVLWLDLGLVPFIAIGLVASWFPLAFSAWAVRRHRLLRFRPRWDVRLWPVMVRRGLPFAAISLALTIAFSIDTVMLSWVVPNAEVGWYNVAYGLVHSVVGLLVAFSQAMVPTLARQFVSDAPGVTRWYSRSLRWMAVLGLPAAVGGMLIARGLVAWLYPPSTAPAGDALMILAWDVPLLLYTAYCGNMSYIIGAERDAARIYTINAVANVVLNGLIIPRYGFLGAAVVTVVTDLIGAIQFYRVLARRLDPPNPWPVLGRVALGALAMGLAVALAGDLHPAWRLGLGLTVYAVLLPGLKVIEASEWGLLRHWAGRLAGRLALLGGRGHEAR
jgi:O-antigen/teichoic acid export membrane protein